MFYIRAQGGFTGTLAGLAAANPNVSKKVLLDGPYGSTDLQKLVRAQRLILVAGGSGAGWLLPMVESFVRQQLFRNSQVNVKEAELEDGKICDADRPTARVILATRDTTTEAWFTAAVKELLGQYPALPAPCPFDIEVHCTSENAVADGLSSTDQSSGSSRDHSVVHPKADTEKPDSYQGRAAGASRTNGRPDLPSIIREEANAGPQSIAVFACGPLSMQSDLANAVAKEQVPIIKSGGKEIYLHMEHFAWA